VLTVIAEYIGDVLDVHALWYLTLIKKENQIEPYLAHLQWLEKRM
jgi:hypothetical protein